MKQSEILLSTLHNEDDMDMDEQLADAMGDEHISTGIDTPLRPDAFDISDQEKIARIEYHFREIMDTLGLDLSDDSLKGTPKRVAKM